MNRLIVAFKVDESSVYRSQIIEENYYFYSARSTLNKTNQVKRLLPKFSFLVGSIGFFLNFLLCRFYLKNTDMIFSLLKRNFVNEFILKLLIKRKLIDEIHIHWAGYGFLPTRSISQIEKSTNCKVLTYNHDWVHFTAGCHVPADCGVWFNDCVECPEFRTQFTNRAITNKIISLKNHTYVSQFQKFFLQNKLNISSGCIVANRTNVINQPSRISFRSTTLNRFILFIGIRKGSKDNKGYHFTEHFLNQCVPYGYRTIGINCSPDLPFDFSFESMLNNEVLKLMNNVNYVVVPSKLETFSMVSHEALSSGCKVIVRKGLAPSTWDHPSIIESKSDSDVDLLKIIEQEISQHE
jgi:hypothetical protein